MRALTIAVLGLGVRSLAFATDANVVVHLYSAPDAGGAVQMCRVNEEIWFPQPNSDSLARVNDDGSLTRRNVPDSGSRPLAISRDDGNGRLVFTEVGTNRIGIFDANGALTEYDIPTSASNPRGITSPNLVWFTEYDGNRIGRLQAGSPGPWWSSRSRRSRPGPLGIAPGPGGSEMWFTENLANKIGRIDANGVITEFDIPTPDSGPAAIVRGFDGSQDAHVLHRSPGQQDREHRDHRPGDGAPDPTPNSSPTDLIFDDFERPSGSPSATPASSAGCRPTAISASSRFRGREAREPRDRLRPVLFRTDVHLVCRRDESPCRPSVGQPPLRHRCRTRGIARHRLRALQSRTTKR